VREDGAGDVRGKVAERRLAERVEVSREGRLRVGASGV